MASRMPADRRLVAVAPEIAGERLFADHMLARLHRLDDHRAVQIGRCADVDDVDFAVGDQVAKAAIGGGNPVPARKIDHVVAPGGDSPDLDIDAVDAPVGIHVQFGDEAAAGQADPDFLHSRMPPVIAVRTALYRTGGILHEPMARHMPPTAASISAVGGSVDLGRQGVLPKRARGQTKHDRADLLFSGAAKAATQPLRFVPRLTGILAETGKPVRQLHDKESDHGYRHALESRRLISRSPPSDSFCSPRVATYCSTARSARR